MKSEQQWKGRILVTHDIAISAFICFSLLACGGGSGLGPGEIKKREDKLKDRLPVDWTDYKSGDYQTAIEGFSETLAQADVLEGVDAVKNEVKAEAQNGIGWAFFQLQDLDNATVAFSLATGLDRRNADAWVGWTGVALAQQQYNDVVQFAIQALETESDYNSGSRLDEDGRLLGHDKLDERHVRLMLAEAYFQLGRYSALDRRDPDNAAAQLRLVRSDYRFVDAGHLVENLSIISIDLQDAVTTGL